MDCVPKPDHVVLQEQTFPTCTLATELRNLELFCSIQAKKMDGFWLRATDWIRTFPSSGGIDFYALSDLVFGFGIC